MSYSPWGSQESDTTQQLNRQQGSQPCPWHCQGRAGIYRATEHWRVLFAASPALTYECKDGRDEERWGDGGREEKHHKDSMSWRITWAGLACYIWGAWTQAERAYIYVPSPCAGLKKWTLLYWWKKLCQQCVLGVDLCQWQGPRLRPEEQAAKICSALCHWLERLLHREIQQAGARDWGEKCGIPNSLANMAWVGAILS